MCGLALPLLCFFTEPFFQCLFFFDNPNRRKVGALTRLCMQKLNRDRPPAIRVSLRRSPARGQRDDAAEVSTAAYRGCQQPVERR